MTDTDELEDRVEQLEQELNETRESLKSMVRSHQQQVVGPALDGLRSDRDDAREQRAELEDAVAELRDRVRDLEVGIDSVIGLAGGESGGPDKRCADLRLGLIRAAEAQPDRTTAAKHWRDVQDFFAEHGHGEVSKPLCFKAMDDAAEYVGFRLAEKHLVLPSGRDGRAIVVDTDELPTSASQTASNNITTRADGGRHESRSSTSRNRQETR